MANTLKVGDEVSYCLRSNNQWLNATVVDKDMNDLPLNPPVESDNAHLIVTLDRSEVWASGPKALRLDVAEGLEPGQFQRRKPKNADEVFEAGKTRKNMRRTVLDELRRGGAPTLATDPLVSADEDFEANDGGEDEEAESKPKKKKKKVKSSRN